MKNKNLFPQFLFGLTVCAIAIGILLGIFLPQILDACFIITGECNLAGISEIPGCSGRANTGGLLALLYVTYLVDLPDVGGRARLEAKGYAVHASCAFEGD